MLHAVAPWGVDLLRGRGLCALLLQHCHRQAGENAHGGWSHAGAIGEVVTRVTPVFVAEPACSQVCAVLFAAARGHLPLSSV